METLSNEDSMDYCTGSKFDLPFPPMESENVRNKIDLNPEEQSLNFEQPHSSIGADHVQVDFDDEDQAKVFESVKLEFNTHVYDYDDASLLSEGGIQLEDKYIDPVVVKTELAVCGECTNLHQLVPSITEHCSSDFQSKTENEDTRQSNEPSSFPKTWKQCYPKTEKPVTTDENEDNGAYNFANESLCSSEAVNSSQNSPLTVLNRGLHSQFEESNDSSGSSKRVLRVALVDCMKQDGAIMNVMPNITPLQPNINFSDEFSVAANHDQAASSELFYCNTCTSNFTSKNLLREHMLTHSTGKPFNCDQCFASFNWHSNLFSHRKVHSQKRLFSCDVCAATFGWKCNLEKHKKLHTKRSDPCQDIFHSVFSNQRLASLLPCNEKKFACSYCPAKFTANSSLQAHIRVHTKEKPFLCDNCPAKFSWKGNLQSHMKTHMRKPFTCDTCFATFKTRIALFSHSKVHRIWRMYDCKICSLQFPRKKLLDEHVRNHCTQRIFHCTTCSMTFATVDSHRIHVKMHHAKKYICLLCNASFSKRRALIKHVYFELERVITTLDRLQLTIQFVSDRSHSRTSRSAC